MHAKYETCTHFYLVLASLFCPDNRGALIFEVHIKEVLL